MSTFVVLCVLFLYFLPAIIANKRGHNSGMAILVLNLFLGWTFLGWVLALVWAFTGDTRSAAWARADSALQNATFLVRLTSQDDVRR
jgi:hypothetical protein